MHLPVPFLIGSQGVTVQGDPAPWRDAFASLPAIAIPAAIEPAFCARMVERAAQAHFAEDDVAYIGTRAIEEPQRVGRALSLLLHSPELLHWLEQATGTGTLRAVAGRLVETRANHRDALDWHDDRDDLTRRLAIVIDLSDQRYQGGQFQLRRKGEAEPLLSHDHAQAGSVLIFAVRPELEHRVTPVLAGGPRRVFAGWFLTQPEHASGALGASG
ncbi:MAG TPA: 2OG-Fe(II) oxygenase [Novosphingobium sp.]|nr:2OG-Fe(II) oxygenase [Novosphingobium sp.]